MLVLVAPVYQHRLAPVDGRRDLGIAPVAENRRGAGVGIDRGEVLRREDQHPIGVVQV